MSVLSTDVRPVLSARVVRGTRHLVLTAALVGAAGAAGRALSWPVLTSTVGPKAYVFAAHPDSEAARFRNAVVGHAIAVGIGLSSLAAFGLWDHRSVSSLGAPTPGQIGAAAAGVGVTVLALELLGSHHAPAAATALLITTGLAKPGSPLIGLVVGLAVVIAAGPLVGRIGVTDREMPRRDRHRREADG